MMTPFEETSNTVNLINGALKDIIARHIKSHFGVDVDIKATQHKGGWDGYYVTFDDTMGADVDKKMRGNKILRTLFSSASLYGTAWYDEPNDTICMRFNVSYKHCDGGSNGHEIGMLYLNVATGNGKWRKY